MGTALTSALGLFNSKIRAGDRGRRAAGDRLLEWAGRNRDPNRPLVWFHAPSVGEGLQAESVIREFRRLRPDCQIIYTHFSPSASSLAKRLNVDVADFLPYDAAATVRRLLLSLSPDLLVFAKLDLWPELATQAAQRGCQVTMVAGTVRPGSARLRWPARALLAPGYHAVRAAAAVSSADAERLTRLGVPEHRVQILGDPRFDSVMHQVQKADPADPLLRFGRGSPTMVAGSTWPRDEMVLLRAFAQLRQSRPDARLILVPHEPTPTHLDLVEQRAVQFGLPVPVRMSQAESCPDLLLVDQVGVLARLYAAGTMAYVGGGYGSAGLHSVLEPAAWTLPVIFGPRWRESREAGLLLQAGGAVALPRSSSAAASELHERWRIWIGDEPGRVSQGRRARQVVEAGLGAAERSARMLDELISRPPLRT
jgi:3-deoxy-D-manno-octulosonic-acid transferase